MPFLAFQSLCYRSKFDVGALLDLADESVDIAAVGALVDLAEESGDFAAVGALLDLAEELVDIDAEDALLDFAIFLAECLLDFALGMEKDGSAADALLDFAVFSAECLLDFALGWVVLTSMVSIGISSTAIWMPAKPIDMERDESDIFKSLDIDMLTSTFA